MALIWSKIIQIFHSFLAIAYAQTYHNMPTLAWMGISSIRTLVGSRACIGVRDSLDTYSYGNAPILKIGQSASFGRYSASD